MSVDPNITKKANDIRTKVYGKEVRESLASGLEEMSKDVVSVEGRQDEVEGQFQAVLDETTGKDVISAPEIASARVDAKGGAHANLKARLDQEHSETMSQLAQKANKDEVFLRANGININNFDEETRQTFLEAQGIDVNYVLGEGNVSPKNTSFFTINKNLFKGEFLYGKGVGGDGVVGYNVINRSEGVYFITQVSPSTTYTLSTSGNHNLFGIFGFSEKPDTVGMSANIAHNIATNVPSQYKKTFTTNADEKWVFVYLSNEDVTPSRVQLEKGDLVTDFEPYDAYKLNIKLLNETDGKNIKPKSVGVEQLEIAEFDDDQRGEYDKVSLSSYHDPTKDGSMWYSQGEIISNQYTTSFTPLDKISVVPGATYNTKFRNISFFNGDFFVSHLDNTNYSTAKDFIIPDHVNMVGITAQFESINDIELVRVSPLSNERKFIMPNLNVVLPGRFTGQKFLHFGDSITSNSRYVEGISDVVARRLGNEYDNLAIGGAKMSYDVANNSTPMSGSALVKALVTGDFTLQDERLATYTGGLYEDALHALNVLKHGNLEEYTIATVQFGTNDFLQQFSIGEMDKDLNTFKGAYSYFVEELSALYPNLKFILVSPPYNDEVKSIELKDYVNAVKDVADHYNLPFVNNYSNAGINDFNKSYYFPENNVHPFEETGIKLLGDRIASAIQNNY